MTSERLPVMILSGFLGSGKTTLLNALLKQDHGFRLAVIVNEFGDVGLDGKLLRGEATFVELDNGCLCCSLNNDLKQTVQIILERGGIDAIVIETTGVADPLGIAWTLSRHTFAQQLRIDAIVTMVDVANIDHPAMQSLEAKQQIKAADILLLNKSDLLEDLQHAKTVLNGLNAQAIQKVCTYGQVPWSYLLQPLLEKRCLSVADENLLHGQHRGMGFKSYAIRDVAPLQEQALEAFLYALPMSIYRVKGIVFLPDDLGWVVLHMVAGRLDIHPWDLAKPPEEAFMVFIGEDFDASYLQLAYDAMSRSCK